MGACLFMLKNQMEQHLKNVIIPFWKQLKDEANGGFYGFYDFDKQLHREADKGVILHSRILWFFSNGYLMTKDEQCLSHASWCYEFIKKYAFDYEYGGVYWSLDHKGVPVDTTKHTYNIAFAIYGLSSYYKITKNQEALALAYQLFDLIETKLRDEVGYLESFTREFEPIDNDKLSENGLMASKTMNTLLHILEAYTELYELEHNEMVEKALLRALTMFKDTLYNKEKKIMEVFFDENMNTISDLNSYGHDIEATWLIDRAVEVLNNRFSKTSCEEGEGREVSFFQEINQMTEEIREHILQVAFHKDSLLNESFKGEVDRKRIWWVQAEAVVGFFNGYEKTKRASYLDAALAIWEYIKEHMIDKRENSEWFYEVDENGVPNQEKELAGPWKCPYHNGRMCFELMKRLKSLQTE